MPILTIPFANRSVWVPSIEDLAIPAVSALIIFLAYTSQYLFRYIEPGQLEFGEAVWFNIFVGCIWYCYDRACSVDPGQKGWVKKFEDVDSDSEDEEDEEDDKSKGDRKEEDGDEKRALKLGMRWCRKCDAVKPPRAHHCRKCGTCIPKMDHHCPWTTNCVSYTTFPHFLRFIIYAVISMSILAYHLFTRLSILWTNRSLPSYLGPPMWALAHLLILTIVNTFTLFFLSILLVRTVYTAILNTTTIESWEIERHASLLTRSKRNGGFVYGPNGQRIHIVSQEFPYDIGLWKNLVQTFNSPNPLMWILPFGSAPTLSGHKEHISSMWEENGFESPSVKWPPLDPDKLPRVLRKSAGMEEAERKWGTVQEEKEAFRKRQEVDLRRWVKSEVVNDGAEEGESSGEEEEEEDEGIDGEPGWTNSDGDRLRDYGVDEEAEVVIVGTGGESEDDEDVPLGELMRRRKVTTGQDA